MPLTVPERNRLRPLLVASVAAGFVSGILYLSLALAMFFLLPIQIVFGRSGWKAGLFAAFTSILAISAGQVWRMSGFGMTGAASLLIALLPPAILTLSIVALNAPVWSGVDPLFRALGITLALSLAALPLVFDLGRDGAFTSLLEESIGAITTPLTKNLGESYEAKAFAASLDVKNLVADAKSILVSSYAAFIFIIDAGSWWLGSRLSGKAGAGRKNLPALRDFRIPYAILWPVLGAWACVFVSLAFSISFGGVFPAIAWNTALVLSLCYATQGVGIISHLLSRRGAPGIMRLAIALSILTMLASPVAGSLLAGALAILGITEVWIPYRNPKGVGA
jgi:hypothetical protein